MSNHVIEEVTCKRCRRPIAAINGIELSHLMPTGHLCGGMSKEEAEYLSDQMAAEVGKPEAVIASMASEPCSFCDRTQEQVYPNGKTSWFAKGQARVCGQCVILMAEQIVIPEIGTGSDDC